MTTWVDVTQPIKDASEMSMSWESIKLFLKRFPLQDSILPPKTLGMSL